VHLYVAVTDGTDIERFLGDLHARCWLAGLGWYMVGAAGQLLERSIVDRVVGTPERLVFEGPPVLDPPLVQDQASRRPMATAGGLLDTMAVSPPLSVVEQARFREALAKDEARVRPEAKTTRKAYVAARARKLAAATGITEAAAAHLIERQCNGILLPGVVLPFDDLDLAGSTVGDVLADPDKFTGATLADPIEGVSYGAGKAMIMRRADGTLRINSFAHGSGVYELQYDYGTAEALLRQAQPEEAADIFVRCVSASTFDLAAIERLRNLAHEISGTASACSTACSRRHSKRRPRSGRRRPAQNAWPSVTMPG
jgi:hypothetical protein